MYKLVTKGDGGSKEELKKRMGVKAVIDKSKNIIICIVRPSSQTRVTLLLCVLSDHHHIQ